jgi:flagellar biosynthesis/type III secretory pathway M-ring protein FliF/YscJ
MKQLFYIVGFVVLMILAYRLMSKIKDVPEENHEAFADDADEELSDDLETEFSEEADEQS